MTNKNQNRLSWPGVGTLKGFLNKAQRPGVNMLAIVALGSMSAGVMTSGVNAAEFTNTSTHREHNFDNARVEPFSEDQGVSHNQLGANGITFPNDNKRGGKVMKMTWKESEYDGSRAERGHELKLDLTDNNEIFCGYYMNVPSSFPTNKKTIVWQLYNWNSAGCDNWTSHLSIEDNELWLTHRGACAGGSRTRVLSSVPRGQDLAIQIRAILGAGNGSMRVIVNGTTETNDTGIHVGFGAFNGNTAQTSVVGVKMGMYCFDTSNYTNNETRVIYYDNFSIVKNKGASTSWKLVDPRN